MSELLNIDAGGMLILNDTSSKLTTCPPCYRIARHCIACEIGGVLTGCPGPIADIRMTCKDANTVKSFKYLGQCYSFVFTDPTTDTAAGGLVLTPDDVEYTLPCSVCLVSCDTIQPPGRSMGNYPGAVRATLIGNSTCCFTISYPTPNGTPAANVSGQLPDTTALDVSYILLALPGLTGVYQALHGDALSVNASTVGSCTDSLGAFALSLALEATSALTVTGTGADPDLTQAGIPAFSAALGVGFPTLPWNADNTLGTPPGMCDGGELAVRGSWYSTPICSQVDVTSISIDGVNYTGSLTSPISITLSSAAHSVAINFDIAAGSSTTEWYAALNDSRFGNNLFNKAVCGPTIGDGLHSGWVSLSPQAGSGSSSVTVDFASNAPGAPTNFSTNRNSVCANIMGFRVNFDQGFP